MSMVRRVARYEGIILVEICLLAQFYMGLSAPIKYVMNVIILCYKGIITDPVYTAKLFHEASIITKHYSLRGNVLIVHSGGGTGLFGRQVLYNCVFTLCPTVITAFIFYDSF